MGHAWTASVGNRTIAATIALTLALFAALGLAGSAAADDWPRAGMTETPSTANSKFSDIAVTAVTVREPLPKSFGAHPTACDDLTFLRMRRVGGPTDPADADRILTAQPGILEGASAFLNVGSATVARAWSERGKDFEFWVMDRRSNCLEDITGLRAAIAKGDPQLLIDYYYGGASVEGRSFSGFLNRGSADSRWLSKMGLDQTLRDWHAVNTAALPRRIDRRAKLYCGGHSLGGLITAAYADYDFDGDPGTLSDAGYNQCRGYFGLDTLVSDDPVKLRQIAKGTGIDKIVGAVGGVTDSLLAKGSIAPFLDIPGVLNPEVMYLLVGVGAASTIAPTTETDLVRNLPANSNVRGAYKTYFSRDLLNFLTGSPGLRDFRMTNQALLGTFIDDNSQPLSIVQGSVGIYDGGPLAQKNFPLPNDVGNLPGVKPLTGLLGTGGLVIPTDPGRRCFLVICWIEPGKGPLYGWRNYDQLAGATIPRGAGGRPSTDASREVTDINDIALSLSAAPVNLVEVYFPLKIALDVVGMIGGSSAATPGLLHEGGAEARPVVNVIAGDGPIRLISDSLSPSSPVVPGYQHLDVMTAAPAQNNGHPEPVVSELIKFAR